MRCSGAAVASKVSLSLLAVLQGRVAAAERDLELERRKVRDLHETHKANAKAYNKLKVGRAVVSLVRLH